MTASLLNGNEVRERAFVQQAEADMVIHFWHWDSLSLSKPRIGTDLNKQKLVRELSRSKTKKNFVVVILDKGAEPEGKEVSVDDLVESFHKLGFRRVVIQQAVGRAHPDGLPILKDSKTQRQNPKPAENNQAEQDGAGQPATRSESE